MWPSELISQLLGMDSSETGQPSTRSRSEHIENCLTMETAISETITSEYALSGATNPRWFTRCCTNGRTHLNGTDDVIEHIIIDGGQNDTQKSISGTRN